MFRENKMSGKTSTGSTLRYIKSLELDIILSEVSICLKQFLKIILTGEYIKFTFLYRRFFETFFRGYKL